MKRIQFYLVAFPNLLCIFYVSKYTTRYEVTHFLGCPTSYFTTDLTSSESWRSAARGWT